jgi:hypothetical protein
VDAELGGELLDPAAGLVRGDETSDAVSVETLLSLPGRALGPIRSRCLGQIQEGAEAFYVVREVRISLDKVHSQSISIF